MVKSEKDFSPTTLYEDYAISDTLFHWQTHNAAGPKTERGLGYINHLNQEKGFYYLLGKKILDEYGNTMAYVFIGEGRLMNIMAQNL